MTDEKTQDEQNTHHEIIDKTGTTNDDKINKIFKELDEAAKKKTEETAAKAAADKNNNTSNKGTQTVKVSDIDIPFESMVIFMVKWAIASIPAILILMVLFAIFGGFFVGIISMFN
jgi:CHASE3 domain sensor protein